MGQAPSDPEAAAAVAEAARRLGFCSVGFTPATTLAEDHDAWQAWLAAGHHGDMAYMATHPRRDVPQRMLPEARTLVVVALPYSRDGMATGGFAAAASEPVVLGPAAPEPAGPQPVAPQPVAPQPVAPQPVAPQPGPPARVPLHGSVARYARGADYHGVLREKLLALAEACEKFLGPGVRCRPCVDSAPLFERGYAARAGVGFAAKNTMTIVPGVGSYVLLGELLIDRELRPSAPAAPRCGSCTRCLVACPTRAFVAPQVLDARRCISYLTIELRGPIPQELRPLIGDKVFGCDICQEVCPFNASTRPRPAAPELMPHDAHRSLDLVDLLRLGSAAYRRLVRGTALRRANRAMLARNAAVALGNSGRPEAVAPLLEALQEHPQALVRGHAAWALGALGAAEALPMLRAAAQQDAASFVRTESTAAAALIARARP